MPFDSHSAVNDSQVCSGAEKLGNSLRTARRSASVSQRALSKKACIDLATVQGLERGRGTLQPLLAVLDALSLRFKWHRGQVDLGPWIASARKSAGFSQQSFASRVGVSKPTINQIEHGRGNISSLLKALEALSLSPTVVPWDGLDTDQPYILHEGDNLAILKTLPSHSVDACVCDPPYGIDYMASDWDGSVPGVGLWREVFRVLKPGGFLLSFGGTRTYHRMVVAVEDAGFDIRDQISWLYGQGMPKSRNVSKDIDRVQGASREVVGRIKETGYARANVKHRQQNRNVSEYDVLDQNPITETAAKFNGHGNGLKPAQEPIVVARKPFKGSIAKNLLKHGVGTFNIDACRVPGENPTIRMRETARRTGKYPGQPGRKGHHNLTNRISFEGYSVSRDSEAIGRFPANIIHDGSPEVVAAFPNGTAKYFYCPKPSPKERADNHHPTVKPVALMSYLVKLVTPAGGTVLDPFAGSGSTGVAAVKEGFRAILMERDPEAVAIILRRMAKET